jgi:hypothetical protein
MQVPVSTSSPSPLHYFRAVSPQQTAKIPGCPKTSAAGAATLATVAPPPSSSSSAPPKASPVNVASMEGDEAQAEALIKRGNIDQSQLSNIQSLIDSMGEGMVQDILTQMQDDPLQPPILFDEAVFRAFAHVEAGAVGVNILSRGAVLVATGMLLNRVEDIVKAKKNALTSASKEQEKELKQDIEKLNSWLKAQKKEFHGQIKNSAGMSLLSIPRGTFAIARIINASSRTADMAGNVFIVTSFAGEAIRMHRAAKGVKVHAEWTNALQRDTATLATIRGIVDEQKRLNKAKIEGMLGSVKKKLEGQFPNLPKALDELRGYGLSPPVRPSLQALREWCSDPKTEEALEAILVKKEGQREEITEQVDEVFAKKMGTEIEQFLSSIENQLQAESPDIAAIKEKLEKAGLKVPENLTLEKLTDWVSLMERQWELRPAAQKTEGLSVSLRNALKTMCEKKNEIDRKFLKFSLTRSKGRFAAACVMTALTITLKVLLYVGVGSAAAGLALTGYGMIAAIGISAIIGAVYLYVKKPNLFKTYAKGVQLQLFFKEIPLAIQRYRKNYTVLKASKLFIELEVLKLSNKDASVIEKKDLELSKLETKIKKLGNSVEKMEERVGALQEKITEAGWKDFYAHLHPKNPAVPTTKEDAATAIAHHLEDPALLQDEETQKLLMHMGIDPKHIGDDKFEIADTLRTFFAMEEGMAIAVAKQQLKKA